MNLQTELQEVEENLALARAEQARVAARVEGLTAERDSLASAIQAAARADAAPPTRVDMSALTKDRAIVEVLRGSETPMRIKEIVQGLADAGRLHENYNGISVYLDTLLSQKRVRRVERGLYEVAT
jgi:hypothetical protein